MFRFSLYFEFFAPLHDQRQCSLIGLCLTLANSQIWQGLNPLPLVTRAASPNGGGGTSASEEAGVKAVVWKQWYSGRFARTTDGTGVLVPKFQEDH